LPCAILNLLFQRLGTIDLDEFQGLIDQMGEMMSRHQLKECFDEVNSFSTSRSKNAYEEGIDFDAFSRFRPPTV